MARKPRYSMRVQSTPSDIPASSPVPNAAGSTAQSAPLLNESPSNFMGNQSPLTDEEIDMVEPTNEPHEIPNASSKSAVKKKSPKYWTVDVIDDNGVKKERHLHVQDLLVLPDNHKVILEWSNDGQPIQESGGLYGVYSGSIAADCHHFPIIYLKWPKVPKFHKDLVWENLFKAKFDVNDGDHKKWIMMDLGKKWKDNRSRLWHMFKNSDMSLEESIERCPMGIPRKQWASFLEYRFEKRTVEIAEKNTANRAKLTIPHTLGAKSIARKKRELEIEKGKPISRAEMYAYSHLKKDGTFVNEEAMEKNDLLLAAQNDGTLSKEDAYVQVFGKEHPGRVRGMGFGVYPSQIFKRRSSSGASSSTSTDNEIRELKSKVQSLEEALTFFVRSFGGQMPPGFASNGLHQPQDLGSPNGFRPSSSASHVPNAQGPELQGHPSP
ncbi:uncharacterized protein LOC133289744 [Gastrolobium bilobum]|uniref:uncharacterized protein LOC133289744 n=1 Tax=Gastrolobium bilobum TaxID=150636 RepID=UPI002AAFF187|nr:uncharacterized protein LOC133289744 [Gastrolobium bilobum]